MFCKKCGQPMADGERFCGNCGTPAAKLPPQPATPQQYVPQPQVQQPYVQQYPYTSAVDSYTAPAAPAKRKMSRGKLIAIIAGSVAACAAIFFAIAFATGLFKSTEQKMRDVTRSSVKNVLSVYTETLKSAAGGSMDSFAIELEPGSALTSLASSQGIDLSWLKSVKLDVASDVGDGDSSYSIGLSLNDTEIVTLNAQLDPSVGQLLMGLDGLSDTLAIPLPGAAAVSGADLDLLIELVEKYLDIALGEIGEVEKTTGSITANGVTADCSVYTIRIDRTVRNSIMKAIVNTALNDTDLKRFIEQIYPYMNLSDDYAGFETYYEEVVLKSLRDTLRMVEEDESGRYDEVITITEYVAGDTLVGIRVSPFTSYTSYRYNNDTDEEYTVTYKTDIFLGLAIHDGRFGMEMTAETYNDGDAGSRQTSTSLKGEGTVSSDKLNGTIHAYSTYRDVSVEIMTIRLEDWDYKDAEGTCEISFTSDAVNDMGVNSTMRMILSMATLRITRDSDSLSIEVMWGGSPLLKATIAPSSRSVTPVSTGQQTTDVSRWRYSLDLPTLRERLATAGVPSSLLDQLFSLLR